MIRVLSAEQLLGIADQVCVEKKCRVRSFAALAACAAVTGARFHGVRVHTDARAAAVELGHTIRALKPLSSANDTLANIATDVYLRWHDM